MIVAVPGWNSQGVIEPFDLGNPTSLARSPYEVSLLDFVKHYAISSARRTILRGFLDYRAALHNAGVNQGFQWVDGSFTEQVELLQSRDPKDVDVVTFIIDGGQVNYLLAAPLFDAERMSQLHHVDAYCVELNIPPRELVFWSSYWYSMWSHRRNQQWKGFLQIDLDPTSDSAALAYLNYLDAQGGTP